jgi:hypothetical protein
MWDAKISEDGKYGAGLCGSKMTYSPWCSLMCVCVFVLERVSPGSLDWP